MLDYEWGNPSSIMLSGEEPSQEPDPTRQIYDHHHYLNAEPQNHHSFTDGFLSQQTVNAFANHHYNHNHAQTQQAQLHSLQYDPRAYGSASHYAPGGGLLTLDHQSFSGAIDNSGGGGGSGYFVVPKHEEVSRPLDFASRIGLNLGGRTYFSSTDDDFVNRLYRRSRPGESGSVHSPRCQAEGCNADLTHAKHYHRRHKVCEFHSKASTVIAAGLTQRFCQQCSRFHLLTEFDNGKRSCRKRLADHNRRRRKSQQPLQENNQKTQKENPRSSAPDSLSRSPQDSGAQSTLSVTVAVSPPRMSLDCFRQRSSYPGTTTGCSSTTSSLFFSSG